MACKICYNPSCSGNCIGGKPNKALADLDFKLCATKPEVPRLDPIGKLDCDDKNCNDEVTRQITIINNNTSGGGGEPTDFEHNNLLGLQGGNLLERYHIEKNIYDSLQNKDLSVNNKVVSQTDLENWKVTSNLSLGDVNELTVSIDNDGGSGVTLPSATPTKAGVISSYDKSKLDGIEVGAQKNVKTDWEATSGDAELLNKPSEFPPSPHTHNISDVNGLQTSLDGKEDKSNKVNTLSNPNNTTYPSTLAVANALQELESPVTSVNGMIGDVIIDKTSVGLSNVDNTSDLDKPISTATQTVLDNKIDKGEKGAPLGVAELDADGLILPEQLPPHTHIPSDILIEQGKFLVGGADDKGIARNILPEDLGLPSGYVAVATTPTEWGKYLVSTTSGANTLALRNGTGQLTITAGTDSTHAVTLAQVNTLLFDKVDKTTTITGNGGVTIGGSLASGAVSIGVNDVYFNNKYIRKDQNDNNGVYKLTLGSVESPEALFGSLTLDSLGTGSGTDELLVVDANGIVKKKSAVSDVAIKVANSTGTPQFTLGATSNLLFEGGGDTSISFNPSTNKVTITSIAGSGSGGAVTSFNGRTGGVVAEVGDYSTNQVTEASNLYFTESRVRATPLTGLSTTNTSAITATDNILQAFGKLQAQTTLRATTNRSLTVSGTAGRVVVSGGAQDLSLDREWIVDLVASGVTAGTYNKVVVDSYGRVTSGGGLTVSDIPILPYLPETWKPTVSEVTGLQTALDGKANISGNNVPAPTQLFNLINLQYLQNNYAPLSYVSSNFARVGGDNATGTWPINVTGTANQWNGQEYATNDNNQDITRIMGYNNTTDKWTYYNSAKVNEWLGIDGKLGDYAKKDGSNATGIWPISISGDAATVAGRSASYNPDPNTIPIRTPNGFLRATYMEMAATKADIGSLGNRIQTLTGFSNLENDDILYAWNNTATADFVRSGASGSWPISVTGSANTWTNAGTVNWDGINTDPTAIMVWDTGRSTWSPINIEQTKDVLGLSNYAKKDGSNATGTWPISVTGNAGSWGGNLFVGVEGGVPNYVFGAYPNGEAKYVPASALRQFMAIPSGGETLQSVTHRGGYTDVDFGFDDGTSRLRFVGASGINYIQSGVNESSSSADLIFSGMNGTSPIMTLKANTGNVGIGTTTPSAKLDVDGGVRAVGSVTIDGNSGNYKELFYKTNGVLRWDLFASASGEGGGNSGSDFAITRYADDGSYLGQALVIERSTGHTTFGGNVTASNLIATNNVFAGGSVNAPYIDVTTGNSNQWNEAYNNRVDLTSHGQMIPVRKVFSGGNANTFAGSSIEVQGNGSTIFPSIGFHQPGIDGKLLYMNNAGTLMLDANNIWTSTNFSQTNIDNWNTAYSWGNHVGKYLGLSTNNTMSGDNYFAGQTSLGNTIIRSSNYISLSSGASIQAVAGSAVNLDLASWVTVPTPSSASDAVNKAYADLSNSYSTTETLTGGTWIDGKPIYRKVINTGALPSVTGTTATPHGVVGASNFIKIQGFAKDPSGASWIPLPAAHTYVTGGGSRVSGNVSLRVSDANIVISSTYLSSDSYTQSYVVLEYTK